MITNPFRPLWGSVSGGKAYHIFTAESWPLPLCGIDPIRRNGRKSPWLWGVGNPRNRIHHTCRRLRGTTQKPINDWPLDY